MADSAPTTEELLAHTEWLTRLARALPDVGDSTVACPQANRDFNVAVAVRPTPNPNFRRVDAQVFDGTTPVLRLSTVVGKY